MADGSTKNGAKYNTSLGDRVVSYIKFVESQVSYHSDVSKKAKRNNGRFSISELILSSLIALVGALITADVDLLILETIQLSSLLNVSVIVLGVLLTLITTVLRMGKYRRLWILHRNMSEELKRELRLFEARVNTYKVENDKTDESVFELFTENIEKIIGIERMEWTSIVEEKPDSGKK